jgi:hypothetical protein
MTKRQPGRPSPATVARWCESIGITVEQWQRAIVGHYWGPPTDEEYLLQRLNARWRDDKDPGPWERDRMKR